MPTQTAPRSPVNFKMVAATATTISLSWVPGDETSPVQVQRKNGSLPFATVATVPPAPATATAKVVDWTDSGLTPATAYTYRIAAVVGGLSSPWSAYLGATTPNATVQSLPPPPVVISSPVLGTASPTSTPTLTPIGTLALMVGSPGVQSAAVTIGMAPKVTVLDVTPFVNVLTDTISWSVPGSTPLGNLLSGAVHDTPMVSVEYQTEGTYEPVCTVSHGDGTRTTYTSAVTVLPDARPAYYIDPVNGNDANAGTTLAAAWKTTEPARSVVTKVPCTVRFLSDTTVPLPPVGQPGYFNPCSEVVFEGIKNAAGAIPVITVGPFSLLFESGGRAGTLFRDLEFTSVGTLGADGFTRAPISGDYRAEDGQTYGIDFSTVRCRGDCLVQFFQQYAGDLSVLDCTTTNANTLNGQAVLATGSRGRLVVLGMASDGTFAEAIVRTDGYVQRFAVGWSTFRQYPDRWLNLAPKPGVDIRACEAGMISNSTFYDCPISLSQSIASSATVVGSTTANVRITKNHFSMTQKTNNQACVFIKDPACNITADNNTWTGGAVPNFLNETGTPKNVVQTNNLKTAT